MNCRKCNAELAEGSLFCNQCGTRTKASESAGVRGSRKRWIVGGSVAVALVLAGIAFFLLSKDSPVEQYKKAIAGSRYEEANVIYEDEIQGDLNDEMAVDAFIQADMDEIGQAFADGSLDYNGAILKLDMLGKTGLLKKELGTVRADIDRLNDSRIAFQTGQAFLADKRWKEALAELGKVSDRDSDNFAKARNLIQTTSAEYKTEALKRSETLANELKYEEAIAALNEGLAVLSKDADLLSKKTVYEKQHEEQLALELEKKIRELRDNQFLVVESTNIYTDWLDDIYLSVVVRNKTEKVVKSFIIGWMGYDKDGYPVKSGWLSPDFLKTGAAEANIQPNKTYGSNSGWRLTGGFDNTIEAAEFIACVKEVEFYDGTRWENEYYDYWVEQHLEQPLQEAV